MRILLAMVAMAAMVFAVACGDDDGATCKSGCEKTIAADCTNGPASQAACEADCDSVMNGSCSSEYQAVMDCSDGKSVTCDASGIPTVSGCDTQMDAFTSCLSM